jgi:hypothetical protein
MKREDLSEAKLDNICGSKRPNRTIEEEQQELEHELSDSKEGIIHSQ